MLCRFLGVSGKAVSLLFLCKAVEIEAGDLISSAGLMKGGFPGTITSLLRGNLFA